MNGPGSIPIALNHAPFVPGNESEQIQVVPTDEIQMLGVPLGSDGKAAAYVEKKLLGKLAGVVNKLADFDDMQSHFFSSDLVRRACQSLHAHYPARKVATISGKIRQRDLGCGSEHLGPHDV